MDVVPFYRNWRENETTWHWQLKPKRTAAASRTFPAAARLSCYKYTPRVQLNTTFCATTFDH